MTSLGKRDFQVVFYGFRYVVEEFHKGYIHIQVALNVFIHGSQLLSSAIMSASKSPNIFRIRNSCGKTLSNIDTHESDLQKIPEVA